MDFPYREYAPLPTGDYPARLEGLEEADGQWGPQAKWTLDLGEVEDSEGNVEARRLSYYTPQEVTPNNKLGKLALACGLELGEALDSSEFLGKRIMVTVVKKPGKEPGTLVNRIEAVAPLPRRRTKPAEAPEMAEADDGSHPF